MLRQVAVPCLLVTAVLLSIFVGYALSRFLKDADAGLLNSAEVFQLTALKLLIALEVLLPIGLFFGSMLGLGRLHSDSEIYALRASGFSEWRMFRAVIALAAGLAIVMGCLSIFVRPWAYATTYQVLAVAKASSDVDRIKPAQFYLTRKPGTQADAAPAQERERAIFVEKLSDQGRQLEGIFIRTRSGDELQVISSLHGSLKPIDSTEVQQLELSQANIFKQVADGPDLFAQIGHLTLQLVHQQPEEPGYKSKSIASHRLKLSANADDMAEYQWRLSTAVSTLLLALLAIPLSRTKPRRDRFSKLLLGLVVYAIYYNLIGVSRTWVEQQVTASIWWVPGLLCLLVMALYIPWAPVRRALVSSHHA
jgi:lipopolysaccharide export system permease protein